jgi:autotransporter passenger strand-loop-strand repeat protein
VLLGSGGEEDVLEGGTASGTTLSSGGSQYVNFGGTASGTIVDGGGYQEVDSGGTASGTAVGNNGYVYLFGTASGTTVSSGGNEYVASGGVESGGTIAGGTLEIASGGLVSGSVSFSGSGGELLVDSTTMPTAIISGFAPGDKIKLANVTYNSATDSVSVLTPGVVTISAGGTTYDLNIAGAYVGETDFSISGDLLLTENAPCFAAGTRILTPFGEIPVENLAVGEMVITREGDDVPIKWIGRRKIDLARHPHPEKARPICFDKGCFGANGPYAALTLSPDHGLYIGGNLIPAKALENGLNICQLDVASVTYYHIELPDHAIIFANGVAVESYLETGNRGAFENGGGAVTLHPDFADFQAMREAKSCAPFTEDGITVGNVRAKILSRWYRREAPKGMSYAEASRVGKERKRGGG